MKRIVVVWMGGKWSLARRRAGKGAERDQERETASAGSGGTEADEKKMKRDAGLREPGTGGEVRV